MDLSERLNKVLVIEDQKLYREIWSLHFPNVIDTTEYFINKRLNKDFDSNYTSFVVSSSRFYEVGYEIQYERLTKKKNCLLLFYLNEADLHDVVKADKIPNKGILFKSKTPMSRIKELACGSSLVYKEYIHYSGEKSKLTRRGPFHRSGKYRLSYYEKKFIKLMGKGLSRKSIRLRLGVTRKIFFNIEDSLHRKFRVSRFQGLKQLFWAMGLTGIYHMPYYYKSEIFPIRP